MLLLLEKRRWTAEYIHALFVSKYHSHFCCNRGVKFRLKVWQRLSFLKTLQKYQCHRVVISLNTDTCAEVHTKSFNQLKHDSSNMDIALDSERLFHLKISDSDSQLPGPIHKSSIGHHLQAVLCIREICNPERNKINPDVKIVQN